MTVKNHVNLLQTLQNVFWYIGREMADKMKRLVDDEKLLITFFSFFFVQYCIKL